VKTILQVLLNRQDGIASMSSKASSAWEREHTFLYQIKKLRGRIRLDSKQKTQQNSCPRRRGIHKTSRRIVSSDHSSRKVNMATSLQKKQDELIAVRTAWDKGEIISPVNIFTSCHAIPL
jgi:hypothetical protein